MKKLLGCTKQNANSLPKIRRVAKINPFFYIYYKFQYIMISITQVPIFLKPILRDQNRTSGSYFLTPFCKELKNLLFLKHFFISG